MWFNPTALNMRRLPGGIFAAVVLASTLFQVSPGFSQDAEFHPGEAFSTRFSGTKQEKGADDKFREVIDLDGVVGSVIDVREPGEAPRGQHWDNEPQRLNIKAGQVGQVFGIAIDDAARPNIYLSATAAFGLHVQDDGGWMPGMWGQNGGPGTIYKLNAKNGYKPEVFATIKLGDRKNSGAALGNIAYDPATRQLFVSDLETGMVHRLDIETGEDRGTFDHGVDGRADFLDVLTGKKQSWSPVEFDEAASSQREDCKTDFQTTPSCWNLADFRRRVWGVGVYQDPKSGRVRLYYALWSSQGFGNPEWKASPEQQVNTIWSVGLKSDGSFDKSDVRREFAIPGFFSKVKDFLRAGASHPVSDIAFSSDGVMLVAERGGMRNKGLGSEDSFATPSEARVLRYKLGSNGKWDRTGRFAVGFYDRKNHDKPYIRAGSSGGVAFGYGYKSDFVIDQKKVDQFAWMTGDKLCSADAPCLNPETDEEDDSSEVHGLQGLSAEAFTEVAPADAFKDYPKKGEAVPIKGVDQSYLIDMDINVDDDGGPIEGELERNDATLTGDVEIYKIGKVIADEASTGALHLPVGSRASHAYPASVHKPEGSDSSHEFPFSIHRPQGSEPSHEYPYSIHLPIGSEPVHEFPYSIHLPRGSRPHHRNWRSLHFPKGSRPGHKFPSSVHWPHGSKPGHKFPKSIHLPRGSKPGHKFPKSIHLPRGSRPGHKFPRSVHWPRGSRPGHKFPKSIHLPRGSRPGHKFPKSIHLPRGSRPGHKFPKSVHLPVGSKPGHKFPKSVHLPVGSKPGHRFPKSVHLPVGSKPGHKFPKSVHLPVGSKPGHKFPKSVHLPVGSKPGHRSPKSVHLPRGSVLHRPGISRLHNPKASRVHRPAISRLHRPAVSRVHRPSLSRVHRPGVSRVHRPGVSRLHRPGVSRIHRPSVSRLHRPSVSRIHKPAVSKAHRPSVSRVHKLRASRLHRTSVSRIHKISVSRTHSVTKSRVHSHRKSSAHNTVRSRVHKLRNSKVHTVKYSKAHNRVRSSAHTVAKSRIHGPRKSGTHSRARSGVHKLHNSKVHSVKRSGSHSAIKSRVHRPRGSRVHRPKGSRIHRPRGSRVHRPRGSRIHRPRGSRVHRPKGSRIHRPRGSRVHRPRGSRIHRPRGSRVHRPKGSLSHSRRRSNRPPVIRRKKDNFRPNKPVFRPNRPVFRPRTPVIRPNNRVR